MVGAHGAGPAVPVHVTVWPVSESDGIHQRRIMTERTVARGVGRAVRESGDGRRSDG
jgi:hypothetical protein